MALSQLSLLETAMQLIFCHVFPEAMGKPTHDVGLHSRDIANQTHHSTTQCEQVCKPNMYSLSLSLSLHQNHSRTKCGQECLPRVLCLSCLHMSSTLINDGQRVGAQVQLDIHQ